VNIYLYVCIYAYVGIYVGKRVNILRLERMIQNIKRAVFVCGENLRADV